MQICHRIKRSSVFSRKRAYKKHCSFRSFGLGKSSMLITLIKVFAREHKYLPISLATWQANEENFSTLTRQFHPLTVPSKRGNPYWQISSPVWALWNDRQRDEKDN